jgi:PAS domain S-box-containing protein
VAPPLSRSLYRLVELIAFVEGVLLFLATGFAYDSPDSEKSVLVLYGERGDLPAIQAVEENMRRVFHTSTSPRIELFSEYLDFTRFPADQYEGKLVRYLQERYAGRRIDLVVPVAGFALEFALSHREELFPGAPLVFCAIEQRELERVRLPADATGITAHFDIERTVKLILQLQPDVSEIVCVSGTSGFDQRWADETRKIMERFSSRVRTRWITGKSLTETVDEVGRLPRGSAVFFLSMLRDGSGQSISSVDAVRDLTRASRAPVYGLSSQFLEAGVVGGAMFDFGLNGRGTAELALKALRGQWVPYGMPETESRNPVLINWPALKKARLSESRIPADAQVRLRPPSLWETHRTFILTVAGAIVLQAIVITGLVLERLFRRRVEASLRESEERMSLVADGASLGMEVWDVERDEVWMTEKGRALFGFERDERLNQAAIVARVHPDDRAARDASIKRAIETGGTYDGEYRVVLPDGTLRWIGARGRSMNGENGEANRLLGVSIDVTAQKHAEAEVLQYREELTHLGRVEILGEMAASLAHELNQPLTGIMNNASAGRRFIAKGRAEMAKIDMLLESVVADARRAGKIIRGIRDMVRKGEEARSLVNLNSIIAEVVLFVRSDALERHCGIATEPDPKLPMVKANPVLLQQVLLNVIINAFDAMQETPVAERRVIIRTERESGTNVRVSVRDFGAGLPVENSERIFEHFFSTKVDGLGMGLTIARSIITSHGGELVAANAKGGGACVSFSLPAAAEGAE